MTTNIYVNAYLEELLARYDDIGWQHCDRGTNAALRAYAQTSERGLNTFMVQDMPFSGGLPAFMATLADAGVTEFLLCERSTALMENLHLLLAEGWQICGTYEKQDRYRPLLGLRVRKAAA